MGGAAGLYYNCMLFYIQSIICSLHVILNCMGNPKTLLTSTISAPPDQTFTDWPIVRPLLPATWLWCLAPCQYKPPHSARKSNWCNEGERCGCHTNRKKQSERSANRQRHFLTTWEDPGARGDMHIPTLGTQSEV